MSNYRHWGPAPDPLKGYAPKEDAPRTLRELVDLWERQANACVTRGLKDDRAKHRAIVFKECAEGLRAALAAATPDAPRTLLELDGYALAGCADRAEVVVYQQTETGDQQMFPSNWELFAAEIRAALAAAKLPQGTLNGHELQRICYEKCGLNPAWMLSRWQKLADAILEHLAAQRDRQGQ